MKDRIHMKDKIHILILLLPISVVFILSIFLPQRSFSENENRFLTLKPELTIEGLLSGDFEKEYESYLTDQFIFRDAWIGIKNLTERVMLKQDSNGVYFGKDDYLIEKQEASVFESEQAISNVNSLASFANQMKESFDVEHLSFVIVPTAAAVLKDKLPPFATPYDQTKLIEQVTNVIGEDYMVDVLNTLKQRQDESIYYRTDHHWTMYGAYYAYQSWAEHIGIDAYPMNVFTVEKVSDSFLGTLASKVNTPCRADDMYTFRLKKPFAYKLTYDMTNDIRYTLYDEDALKEKDKYKLYMGGNYGLVEINTRTDTGRNLLVIKDSFAHSFVPFAVNHFDNTYMIDLRYFNMDIETYMEQYDITDLLILYSTANLVTDKNIWKLQ